MNRALRFPCPRCKEGFISYRVQTDLLTDKIVLSHECRRCGYKLDDYINSK